MPWPLIKLLLWFGTWASDHQFIFQTLKGISVMVLLAFLQVVVIKDISQHLEKLVLYDIPKEISGRYIYFEQLALFFSPQIHNILASMAVRKFIVQTDFFSTFIYFYQKDKLLKESETATGTSSIHSLVYSPNDSNHQSWVDSKPGAGGQESGASSKSATWV